MTDTLSFWLALLLAVGTLLFYLSGALWNRESDSQTEDFGVDFNLGLPKSGNRENLFAMTLVAAGTSLSTVFVFFLTAGSLFGIWLIICPLFFAAGNWVMFWLYKRTVANGYFEEAQGEGFKGGAGLLPYLGERLTGCPRVGWFLLVLSLINLLAVLVLELVVGVDVFGYLAAHTFGTMASSIGEFSIFAVSVALLLGYVFIGGFRAVVSSDVWQMKAMIWAVVIALLSLGFFAYNSGHTANLQKVVSAPPFAVLGGFILNVILGNLFVPLSQEASWQRFRAFSSGGFNPKTAMWKSVVTAMGLWTGLILTAFGMLAVISSDKLPNLSSMSGVLESMRTLNDSWFPLTVFPIMTVAALSAMYSTADTCVSALLYLIEYSRRNRHASTPSADVNPVMTPTSYRAAMLGIFVVALGVYAFVRIWFNPTILQLVFSVFSNLVVLAPTVITTGFFKPKAVPKMNQYVFVSLALGSLCYWGSALSAIILGPNYLWLTQLAIALGLFGAAIPLAPVWFQKRQSQRESAIQGKL